MHVYLSGHVHAAEVAFPVATGGFTPTQKGFVGLKTVFQAMLGFPGDEEVCCNKWQHPTPAYSAWRTDDVAADGGTFGLGEFVFESDTLASLSVWSTVNRTVMWRTELSFA